VHLALAPSMLPLEKMANISRGGADRRMRGSE